MTYSPKELAAIAALDFIADGMTVGLGTGSTAAFFIDHLAEKIRQSGWDIFGIPTSEGTRAQAAKVGIQLIIPDEMTQIDVAVDGADEIDRDGTLIKGGGGALLREKIIAAAAQKFIVIADASKDVAQLGAFALPIELDQFGWAITVRQVRTVLAGLGYKDTPLVLRSDGQGRFILSDGGHYILDARLGRITDAAQLDFALSMIPAVVTTGLFVGLVDTIILGQTNGVEKRYVRRDTRAD